MKRINILLSLPTIVLSGLSCFTSALLIDPTSAYTKTAGILGNLEIMGLLISSLLTIFGGIKEILSYADRASSAHKNAILLERLVRAINRDIFYIESSTSKINEELIDHMIDKIHNDIDQCLSDTSDISISTIEADISKQNSKNLSFTPHPTDSRESISLENIDTKNGIQLTSGIYINKMRNLSI